MSSRVCSLRRVGFRNVVLEVEQIRLTFIDPRAHGELVT